MIEHGVEPEFAAQRQWLNAFWERSDVVVHGQPALQQAIRWNLFHSLRPRRALSSRGARQGCHRHGLQRALPFWDTEIFVVPFLTYTSPQMARSELRFRYNMLGAAAVARRNWPKTAHSSPGVRSTARRHRPITRPARRSITSTQTLRLRSAVRAASGDQDFMNREGVDLLVETARLWADLGFWQENGAGSLRSFHIHG